MDTRMVQADDVSFLCTDGDSYVVHTLSALFQFVFSSCNQHTVNFMLHPGSVLPDLLTFQTVLAT